MNTLLSKLEDTKNDEKSKDSREKYLRNLINSTKDQINYQQVVEVQSNKYLYAAFQIRKLELQITHGESVVSTNFLLHATSAYNVESILSENLNWRYVTRSKYGNGVSFSHDANYANTYCNKRCGTERAFIVCEVLMGRIRRVSDNDDLYPTNGAHTYRTYNNFVVVKFDDFTFYPVYVVYYSTLYTSRNLLGSSFEINKEKINLPLTNAHLVIKNYLSDKSLIRFVEESHPSSFALTQVKSIHIDLNARSSNSSTEEQKFNEQNSQMNSPSTSLSRVSRGEEVRSTRREKMKWLIVLISLLALMYFVIIHIRLILQ